ncbi:MAG TPA: enoyl-CoA hydratase-related protein, partial [Thermoanaerobaculia bacterium]|nr:enoyl-CoA hydratase-related protein [Thermoanaerobaculia bacterium]
MPAFNLQIDPDGLAILTFDLPGEKVNKFSKPVLAELDEVVGRLAGDMRVRALLIESGKPDVFIAGADVKEFVTAKPHEVEPGVRQVQQLFQRVACLGFPTVAAIGGACLGGGTELALACDYRLMSDSKKAQVGMPEVRLGIFPAWGGTTRTPRLVGLASGLDLILTGKSLNARRAQKVGLVDEAVPAPIFGEYIRRFARGKIGT